MYLMNKDRKIAHIDFDNYELEIYMPFLMPFGLRYDNVTLYDIRDWLTDRIINIDRANAKKIISSLNLNQNNKLDICMFCKGLSLTDCY